MIRLVSTAIVFMLVFIVYRVGAIAISRVGKKARLHKAVFNQIRWTLGLILIVAAFVPILWIWEIDLTPLGLSLGILAVAVGFASQNIVTNFLSTVLLIIERAYSVGDVIRVGKTTGRVVHIGLQATKMWTADNVLVSIPNTILASSEIVNMKSGRNETTLTIEIPVDHYADLNKAKQVTIEATKKVKNVVKGKNLEIAVLQGRDDWGVILKLVIVVKSAGWHRTRSDLIEAIKESFDKSQIPPPIPPIVRREELKALFQKNA